MAAPLRVRMDGRAVHLVAHAEFRRIIACVVRVTLFQIRYEDFLQVVQFYCLLNELVKLAVSNHFHKRFRILLDINGYKDSKYSRLVRMARKYGHDVQRTKTTYTFDPMPADERRAIHNALNNMPNIRTESIGEGAQRQVQIIYVE